MRRSIAVPAIVVDRIRKPSVVYLVNDNCNLALGYRGGLSEEDCSQISGH